MADEIVIEAGPAPEVIAELEEAIDEVRLAEVERAAAAALETANIAMDIACAPVPEPVIVEPEPTVVVVPEQEDRTWLAIQELREQQALLLGMMTALISEQKYPSSPPQAEPPEVEAPPEITNPVPPSGGDVPPEPEEKPAAKAPEKKKRRHRPRF